MLVANASEKTIKAYVSIEYDKDIAVLQNLRKVWKCLPNILSVFFLISLRLPLFLIKPFISSLDNTLNPSNVTFVEVTATGLEPRTT